MKSFVYLGSPYTAVREGKPDEELMEQRFISVSHCFQNLVHAGLTVYCPIVMTHKVDLEYRYLYGHRLPSRFWYNFDDPFLQAASGLYVLKLRGWQESKGLRGEIGITQARNIPILYLEDTSVED